MPDQVDSKILIIIHPVNHKTSLAKEEAADILKVVSETNIKMIYYPPTTCAGQTARLLGTSLKVTLKETMALLTHRQHSMLPKSESRLREFLMQLKLEAGGAIIISPLGGYDYFGIQFMKSCGFEVEERVFTNGIIIIKH